MIKVVIIVLLLMALSGCGSMAHNRCTLSENATGGLTEACGIHGNRYYSKDALGNYSRTIPFYERHSYKKHSRGHHYGRKK